MAKLPKDYQEVEYLQGDGNSYINTNFSSTNKTDIEIEFVKTTNHNTIEKPFGIDIRDVYINISVQQLIVFYCGLSTKNSFVEQTFTDFSNKHSYKITHNGNCYIDNVLKGNTSGGMPNAYKAALGNIPIPLFCTAATNNTSILFINQSKVKIYSFKIYDNEIKVRDYIPCYRKSDNVAGMYDLVNDVFYTNQGTGTFAIGPEVEPTPESPFVYTTGTITIGSKTYTATKADYSTYKTSTGTIKIDNKDYTATKVYGE